MTSTTLSQKQLNFARFSILCVDIITLPLKDILDIFVKPADLDKKIKACPHLLTGKYKLDPDQKKKCCYNSSNSPDYSTFDITLLYKLIRYLCPSLKPPNKWGTKPTVNDVSIGDDIERIRELRNKRFAHAECGEIPDDDFMKLWSDAKRIIQRCQHFTTSRGCNTDYNQMIVDLEKRTLTFDEYISNIECSGAICISGDTEVLCGNTGRFEAEISTEQDVYWPLNWDRVDGLVREQIDIENKKYEGSDTRNLIINNVCMEDRGGYQAVISRKHDVKILSNMVYLRPKGDLPCLEELNTTTTNGEIYIHYVFNVSDNSPTVNDIKWTKDESFLELSSNKYRGGGLADNCLAILRSGEHDKGEYTCTVSNAVGPVSKSIKLDIPSAEILSTTNLKVMFGSDTKLKCSVSGYPSANKVEWQNSLDGTTFIPTDIDEDKYFGSSSDPCSPFLLVRNATLFDQQYYRVIVTNEIGKYTSNRHFLQVTGGRPNMSEVTCTFQGHSVKLNCGVFLYDESPALNEVYWTKNGMKIDIEKNNGKYSGMDINDPSLTINRVNHNDAGEYQLTAVNAVGETESEVIVLGVPKVHLEKCDKNEDGSLSFTMTIISVPVPHAVQWIMKEHGSDSVQPINVNVAEYRGTTNTFPHPVLVIKHLERLENCSFEIEVKNRIGEAKARILGDISQQIVKRKQCTLGKFHIDGGSRVPFSKLLNELAGKFPKEKVNQLKYLIRVSCDIKDGKELDQAKNAADCFTILWKEELITTSNVIAMQFLLQETACEDLEKKCVEFAKKQNAIYYYEKPPENGWRNVRFHVDAIIHHFSTDEETKIKETVANIVGCSIEDIRVHGYLNGMSFFIVLAIKDIYIEKLLNIKEHDKDKLRKLNIDYFKDDFKTISLKRTTGVKDELSIMFDHEKGSSEPSKKCDIADKSQNELEPAEQGGRYKKNDENKSLLTDPETLIEQNDDVQLDRTANNVSKHNQIQTTSTDMLSETVKKDTQKLKMIQREEKKKEESGYKTATIDGKQQHNPEIDDDKLRQFLSKGEITVCHVRCIIVGCGKAGKTTLLKRLQNVSFDKLMQIERTEMVDFHVNSFEALLEEETIQSVEKEDTLPTIFFSKEQLEMPLKEIDGKMAKETHRPGIRKKNVSEKSSLKNTTLGHIENIPMDILKNQANNNNAENEEKLKFEPHSPDKTFVQNPFSPEPNEKHGEDIDANVDKFDFEKYAILKIKDAVNELLNETDLRPRITFLDFAGQSMFYAFHQIFLCPKSCSILVVDMTKSLDDKVDVQDENEKEFSQFASWRYRDYYKFWLRTIDSFSDTESPVIIVGTHADKLSKEECRKFLESLFEFFDDWSHSNLSRHLNADRVCTIGFPVSGSELEDLKDLKKCVANIVKCSRWKEPIRPVWALFEHILNKMKETEKVIPRKTLSDYIEQLSVQEFRMDESDISKMLSFFHRVGVLLYFDRDGLKEKIILDIQWLLDAFKCIIEYPVRTEENDMKRRHFYSTGELDNAELDNIWNIEGKDFLKHKTTIIAYMQQLGLLMPLKELHSIDSTVYYFPSMNGKRFDKTGENNSKSSILCFKFDDEMQLPINVFHSIVLKCSKLNNWSILTEGAKNNICLYQNAACFSFQKHVVVLCNCNFEIRVQVWALPEIYDGRLLKEIKHSVEDIIHDDDLSYEIGYKCRKDVLNDEEDVSFISQSIFPVSNHLCEICDIDKKHVVDNDICWELEINDENQDSLVSNFVDSGGTCNAQKEGQKDAETSVYTWIEETDTVQANSDLVSEIGFLPNSEKTSVTHTESNRQTVLEAEHTHVLHTRCHNDTIGVLDDEIYSGAHTIQNIEENALPELPGVDDPMHSERNTLPLSLEDYPCDKNNIISQWRGKDELFGSRIGLQDTNTYGCVGFLVKSNVDSTEPVTGFLTTAHSVIKEYEELYDANCMLSEYKQKPYCMMAKEPRVVFQYTNSIFTTPKPVGEVVDAFCGNYTPPGSDCAFGMDAAFVKSFIPYFGEIRPISIIDDSTLTFDGTTVVIKRNRLSGNTYGVLIGRNVDIAVRSCSSSHSLRLFNCFEVRSINENTPFFTKGESGSAVYVKGKNNMLMALGIAFAFAADGKTYVCRIDNIIQALNVSIYQEEEEEDMETEDYS